MSFDIVTVPNSGQPRDGKLSIAVTNIHLNEENILASAEGSPNVPLSRRKQITTLLNSALTLNSHIDLIVLPEVSIPYSLISYMQRFCRRNQIGLIFGLEHRLIEEHNEAPNSIGTAYNHVVTLLPYTRTNGTKVCRTHRRLKKYYAPGEAEILAHRHISVPPSNQDYPLFHWRGCYFTVFNCYELANVQDRALFRSKVDFMVVAEWNRDTNYFSNIAESAARDLHCFFIQVNTSQYGDSRIVSPSKTETMNILRTKGGKNETLLVQDIHIDALRNFQLLSHSGQSQSDRFKLTPPDFQRAEVQSRINNEHPSN